MNFVDLQKETLSVAHNGENHYKSFYKGAISITGVTDETYPEYDQNGEYLLGDKVIVPELKSIYASTAGDETTPNVGNYPPAATTKWTFYSYINSQNMFALDENIGSKTVGTDTEITLEFNMINVLGLTDIDFESLHVKQVYNETGETWDEFDVSSKDISFKDFAEYCFKPLKKKRKAILDLAWLPSSMVTLTFSGEVSIGVLGRGLKEDLGMNLIGNKIDWESNSKFKVDTYTGFRTVLRQGKVRVLSADIVVKTQDLNSVAVRVDEIFDRNMLWIPTIQDEFNEAITIGYLERCSMRLDSNTIPTSTKIVEVSQ